MSRLMKQQHKDRIGAANKGRRLNMSQGEFVVLADRKLCNTCKEWKNFSEYHKRPDRPIGLRAKCKLCERTYRLADMVAQKFTEYKSGAKKRGIDFNLSKEEFLSLWQKPCAYCGDEILTIGIDRADSSTGYTISNVVPCCAICNTMKLAIPRNIFIAHCQKVAKRSFSINQPD